MTKKYFFLLHLLLLIYSLSEVFSKLAAGKPFMSPGFILFYGLVIAVLFLYAVGWQQVIKQMPLSSAYANKAVTTVWGMIWGVILFGERITAGKVIGIALIVLGVVLFTKESVNDRG